MRLILAIAALAAIAASSSAQIAWDAADRDVRRLPPVAFKQLPNNLVADLQRRGCTIPQVPTEVSMSKGRANVIRGEFQKPGQTDWAVLCSVGRVASILIYWNGSEIKPAEIAKMNDIDGLQGWTGGKAVYSRLIEPVGKRYIMEHYQAYGGPKPPPINHQGINDVFVGKASVVMYWYGGKWLQLSGAD
ncbi:MAG: hypothetical protein ACLPWF_11600 [Bryobacteraceae bacterium]